MYQCSKKLVTYKEYCCFDHSDFLTHSIFTFDVWWGSLGTSIFGNSSSVASNTRSRLDPYLSVSYDYDLLQLLINQLWEVYCFYVCWKGGLGWFKIITINSYKLNIAIFLFHENDKRTGTSFQSSKQTPRYVRNVGYKVVT